MGRHVFLIGMRGVGKSTLAPLLARALARPSIDLDRRIAKREGRSVAAIFARDGEARFRELEERELRALAREPASVVAVGGGIVERAACMRLLARLGTSIWLQQDARTIAARLDASGARPLLASSRGASPGAEVGVLMRRRGTRYRRLADAIVRCGGASPAELARRCSRIVSAMQ